MPVKLFNFHIEVIIIKYLWLSIFTMALLWSGINPKDYFTWFLEVLPAPHFKPGKELRERVNQSKENR